MYSKFYIYLDLIPKDLYNYSIITLLMAEVETITRKWGNSLGITLPKEMVDKENLIENQRVIVEIKQVRDIRKLRGLVRFSRSAQQLKDAMRAGWK